ncbi:hypothetical protein SKAU_G00289960 [Synaphobranchus kaupii]|uniref:Uncharacterized protein n=1 Tax=Synaphobranchus kaupii TaxID=118154 RepID=A0A9Q1IM68_SYNKA|nr:hypothetical protein SKAU_G00289960 [Synaphobranchus kaupii]
MRPLYELPILLRVSVRQRHQAQGKRDEERELNAGRAERICVCWKHDHSRGDKEYINGDRSWVTRPG